MKSARFWCKTIVTLLMLCAVHNIAAQAAASGGAEIHSVQPHSPAAVVGLAAGDRVMAWVDASPNSAASSAPIAGPIEAMLLELERADLHSLVLIGHHSDSDRRWALPTGRWGATFRPIARTPFEAHSIDAALQHAEAEAPEKACAAIAALVETWSVSDRESDTLWAQWTCLSSWLAARRNDRAALQAEAVLQLAEQILDNRQRGLLALLLADASIDAELWALAERALDRVEAAIEVGDRNLRAKLEISRGVADLRRGQGALAAERFNAALALLEPDADNSLRAAAASCELGFAYLQQAQATQAIEAARDGLSIAQRLAPGGMQAARCGANLGLALNERGNVLDAQAQITAALALYDRLAPETTRVASTLNALSNVQANLGDVVGQERSLRRALAINERLRPGSSSVAISLQNLAQVARLRGNLDEARQLAERARDIFLEVTPDSPNVAFNHHLLGLIAQARSDAAEATAQFAASAALLERIAPQSLHHAWALNSQGDLAYDQRDFDAALAHYQQSLEIRLNHDANLEERALSWTDVGLAKLALAQWDEARIAIENGIALFESIPVPVVEHAAALHARGKLLARGNDRPAALQAYCAAADVIDRFRERVSTEPETQAQAIARYAQFHNDCVIAKIEAGDPAGALETLERGRARAMATLLGRRSLADHPALPLELKRLWLELEAKRAAARSRLLASNSEPTNAASANLQLENSSLELEFDTLIERIRTASPQLAQLFHPTPITFPELARQIPANTAVVHFVVGDDGSFVLISRNGDRAPVARRIDLRRDMLDAGIGELRNALLRRTADRDALLQRWHARLIAPLLTDLDNVGSLTIVPEDSLFQLPFAALRDSNDDYLVERFAISIVDSATVWTRLATHSAASRTSPKLVAVALPDVAAAHARFQPAGFASIPGVLSEATAISAQRPEAQLLQGAAATESAVQRAAIDAGQLHFAVHGVYNPNAPLESGLLLQPDASRLGASGDGFLQAWEILRDWRTSAHIVTLSSCDTGRGDALAGEGLIGLTRAFQYAGASNVVASLWEAPDRSTARLMTRFYEALDDGLPPDRALQAAQLALLAEGRPEGSNLAMRGVGAIAIARRKNSAANDPLYWAAFEVFGSGR